MDYKKFPKFVQEAAEQFGEFREHLVKTPDDWVFVIFAHIKIQKVLEQSISHSLSSAYGEFNETSFKNAVKGFDKNCFIAHSIGIIDERTLKGLQLLNAIRNDISHQDNYKLTEDIMKNFITHMGDEGWEELPRELSIYEKFKLCVGELYMEVFSYKLKVLRHPSRLKSESAP